MPPNFGDEKKPLDSLSIQEKRQLLSQLLAKPTGLFLLSPAQQRMWFLQKWDPSSAAYNIHFVVKIIGDLDIKKLQQSLDSLSIQHEALRTIFPENNGNPVAKVLDAPHLECRIIPASDCQDYQNAIHLCQNECTKPFSLEKGPLFRVLILPFESQKTILAIFLHHIICDAWAGKIILEDLVKIYTDQKQIFSPLSIRYTNYALAQEQSITSSAMQEQLKFWLKELSGELSSLEFPQNIDFFKQKIETFTGGQLKKILPQSLYSKLKVFAEEKNITPFMVVLATLKILLYRYTQQEDILVSTPIANRFPKHLQMSGRSKQPYKDTQSNTQQDLQQLVGVTTNTIILRSKITPHFTFNQFLQQIKETCLACFSNSEYPVEKIIPHLSSLKNIQKNPLFQIMLDWQNITPLKLAIKDLILEPIEEPIFSKSVKFDLHLSLSENQDNLTAIWEYRCRLFSEQQIIFLHYNLEKVLETVLDNPNIPLESIRFCGQDEKEWVQKFVNNTFYPYSQKNIVELWQEQWPKNPDNVSVIMDASTFVFPSLSYKELEILSNQFANFLIQQTLQSEFFYEEKNSIKNSDVKNILREQIIAIMLPRCLHLPVTLLAVLKISAAYLPLDPETPIERSLFMLQESGAKILITQKNLIKIKLPGLIIIDIDEIIPLLSQISNVPPDCLIHLDQTAYIIYTSGSTGRPKGVMVSHRALQNRLQWMQDRYKLTTFDRILQKTTYTFDVSVWEFFLPILTGATLVLSKPHGQYDSEYLAKIMYEQRISIVHFVPSMLRIFLEQPNLQAIPSLRCIICSGEILPIDVMQNAKAKLQTNVENLYGPTEAAIDVTYWPCQGTEIHSIPIGYPIHNIQMYVIDKNWDLAPIGMVGELVIAGIGLARGYCKNPELTASKFVPNPFKLKQSDDTQYSAESRMYLTGDLARYRQDGSIEFLGRKDHQVKLRGFRIELTEIENALRSYPGIQDAAVILREDISNDPRLVAYLVVKNDLEIECNLQKSIPQLPSSELRKFLLEKLPSYMIPSHWVFLEKMPMTSSGKLDRKSLPIPNELKSYSASDTTRQSITGLPLEYKEGIKSPNISNLAKISAHIEDVENPLVVALISIFEQVLCIDKISPSSNFFELGGHSLLAVHAISLIRKIFSIELSLPTFFSAKTPEKLAQAIMEIQTKALWERPDIIPTYQSIGPLSLMQEPIWLFEQAHPKTSAYNMPIVLYLQGLLNKSALEESVAEMIRRYPVLETKIYLENNIPKQEIKKEKFSNLPQISVLKKDLPKALQDFCYSPFDLNNGRLFKITLFKINNEEHVLAAIFHHLISDGRSLEIWCKELWQYYENFSHSLKLSKHSSSSLKYLDFCIAQRNWATEEIISHYREYWQKKIGNLLNPLELPLDFPRPNTMSFSAGTSHIEISEELTQQLRKIARSKNTTFFNILLAGFQILLSRYTGQTQILVGVPMSGRNWMNTENILGMFVNTMVILGEVLPNLSFDEFLKNTTNSVIEAYQYQDIPLDIIFQQPIFSGRTGHPAIVSVMFNMLGNENVNSSVQLNHLNIEPWNGLVPNSKFDLTIYVKPSQNGFKLLCNYCADLFSAVTIEQLLKHYQCLLQNISSKVSAAHLNTRNVADIVKIQDLRLLPLDYKLPKTHEIYPIPNVPFQEFLQQDIKTTIGQRFLTQVAQYPNNIAIVLGNEKIEYHQLNWYANKIANWLIAQKLERPTAIALLFGHSNIAMLATILGVLKSGHYYVAMDPSYPEDRLLYIIQNSEAKMIFCDDQRMEFASKLAIKSQLSSHNTPLKIFNTQTLPENSEITEPELQYPVTSESLAYILYTSGSTGKPKGVFQNHRNVLHFMRVYTNNLHISSNDRLTLVSSYTFDAAVMDIFATFLNGATLYPLNIKEHGITKFAEDIISNEITIYHSTPTVYRAFVGTISEKQEFPKLRLIVLGGEPVYRRDVELYRKHFTKECLFVNGLGPSESTVSFQFILDHKTPILGNNVPVGYPVSDTDLVLLDNQQKPTEIYGEICIRSQHVALGYWKQPDITQTAFLEELIPDNTISNLQPPIIKNPILRKTSQINLKAFPYYIYRTGDMGRLTTQGLTFVSRRDAQIKIRGYRVEPAEIEAILQKHVNIAQAAVVCQDISGTSNLVAYLVVKKHTGFTTSTQNILKFELRTLIRSQLPEYMIPSYWIFLEQLPFTPNGKLDKRNLPIPEPSENNNVNINSEYDSLLQHPYSQYLRELISQILNISEISWDTSLFELGANSILLMQILARIHKKFGILIPLEKIFQSATLRNFAQQFQIAITTQQGWQYPQLEKQQQESSNYGRHLFPLSYAQQRMWFLQMLQPDNISYHIFGAVEIAMELDENLIKATLDEIFQRHNSLHTIFPNIQGEPQAMILQRPQWGWQKLDATKEIENSLSYPIQNTLDASYTGKIPIYVMQWLQQQIQKPIDLQRGPLVRYMLIKLSQQRYIFGVVMHHIISDGWSFAIMVDEFAKIYSAKMMGASFTLPECKIQYNDYVVWQRKLLQPNILGDAQLNFWKKYLTDVPQTLELMTDFPRPNLTSWKGGRYRFNLPHNTLESLQKTVSGEGTLATVLFASYAVLLYRYSQQTEFVIGMPIAGRNFPELERIIGLFVNTLAIRVKILESESFQNLLNKIQQDLLQAYSNQDMPFEKVLEAIQAKRNVNRTPLFQVMFVVQNTPVYRLRLGSAKITPCEVESGTTKFDLTLGFIPLQSGNYQGYIEYNSDLFKESTIVHIAQDYLGILTKIIDNVTIPISEIYPAKIFPLPSDIKKYENIQHISTSKNTSIPQNIKSSIPTPTEPIATSFSTDTMEKILFELWQEVLGVSNIRNTDNFFDLGGHSLLLAKLHHLIQQKISKEIDLMDVFRYPTISSFCQFWNKQQQQSQTQENLKEGKYLSEAQRRAELRKKSSIRRHPPQA